MSKSHTASPRAAPILVITFHNQRTYWHGAFLLSYLKVSLIMRLTLHCECVIYVLQRQHLPPPFGESICIVGK
jgi:hypothetical protein